MPRPSLVPRGTLAAMLLVAAVLFPATARGALLDANCPGPASGDHAVNSDERRAQTFTAQHTGTIVSAQLEIHSFAGGSLDFQLQILATDASGIPIEGILARAAIPTASVPGGNFTLQGSFQPPAQVTAGKQYALVATRGQPFDVRVRQGNPCPGQEYSSTSQGPFTPFAPGDDLVFQVFVNPANGFTIGKLKKRKLTVSVPGEGVVAVADATPAPGAVPAAAGKKLLKSSQVAAPGAGDVAVKLRLTKRGKQRLGRKGKLKARAAVTFTPTGGDPNTVTKKLKLKR